MKLRMMAKYRSAISGSKAFLCFLLLLLPFPSGLYSQTYKLTFRNTPLSEALISVSSRLDVKVAFDSKKLGVLEVNREITGNSADEVISDLLKNTGFRYKLKYNRYLIVEDERHPGSSAASTYQVIGSVSDRRTGEQLPFATILVFDQDLQTSSSENGSFSLQDIISNPLHIQVSYIGYNPIDTTILLADKLTNINLRLSNTFHVLDSIVVEGSKTEMVDLRNDVDFATTINMSKLTDLPALAETDIFRMLQVLPGVSYGENSPGLSIRGGSTDQNLILFDGQTLYNLSHYYGVVSALNPNVIKDLQVYKGGYDSRFGERVSGIVDITGKSGNQTRPALYGDVNLLSANVTAEIPVGKKISLIGAVRRSYSDIYSTELSRDLFDRNMDWFRGDSSTIISQTKPKFYFYDYNAKISFRPGNMESFSLSLYGGKDYFRNSYSGSSRDLEIDASDKNIWSNYGVSASWMKQWNGSFYSAVQAGVSGYDNESSNATTIDRTFSSGFDPKFLPDTINDFNIYNRNKLKDYYFSIRNNLQISAKNQLSFGFLARDNSIYYHKDADREYVYDNMNQSGWTLSSYLQDRIIIRRKLIVKPGVRFSYFNNNDGWYAEPRFSANYSFSNAFSVRVAAGKYYQFINQVLAQQETGYNKYFWIMADDRTHPAVSSIHNVGGMTFEKGKFLLDAEAYYKTYTGLQEYVFVSQFLKNSDFHKYFPGGGGPGPVQPPPSFYVTGTGRAYGLDLLLRYRGQRYTSWLSGSFGRSLQNYSEINYGNDIPSPVDQPFQLSWTNMLSAGRWNFGTMTFFSSGRPYIDNTGGKPDQTTVRNYKRLPDYFRTDLSVNYSMHIGNARLKPGIALINVFNTHNYFDVSTRRFDFESTSFSEAILVQSQAFSINAFVHFLF